MKTTAEMIEVMQAFERGEKIESHDARSLWSDCSDPVWDWVHFNYRIALKKKKTVELYQWLCFAKAGGYWISNLQECEPPYGIRRLDETRMVVEVEE